MGNQLGERNAQPLVFRFAERDERATAAFDVQCRLTAEEDDLRARDARGPRPRPLRPREHGAVRLGRIGGRKDERVRLLLRTQLAQPLDRTWERELRTAETLDEIAAPAHTNRLERFQLAVDRAVAAGDSLAADAVARDDSLPLEQ